MHVVVDDSMYVLFCRQPGLASFESRQERVLSKKRNSRTNGSLPWYMKITSNDTDCCQAGMGFMHNNTGRCMILWKQHKLCRQVTYGVTSLDRNLFCAGIAAAALLCAMCAQQHVLCAV